MTTSSMETEATTVALPTNLGPIRVVDHGVLVALCEALGVDIAGVRRIEITPGTVWVEIYVLDEDGMQVRAGDDLLVWRQMCRIAEPAVAR